MAIALEITRPQPPRPNYYDALTVRVINYSYLITTLDNADEGTYYGVHESMFDAQDNEELREKTPRW